mmetsp:Transcript_27879/g.75126  ORF Transcript_27879/g.75126 Transcript_27879/m.75126 type:complete len:233 (+) Transcript_27879:628-1326(+)
MRPFCTQTETASRSWKSSTCSRSLLQCPSPLLLQSVKSTSAKISSKRFVQASPSSEAPNAWLMISTSCNLSISPTTSLLTWFAGSAGGGGSPIMSAAMMQMTRLRGVDCVREASKTMVLSSKPGRSSCNFATRRTNWRCLPMATGTARIASVYIKSITHLFPTSFWIPLTRTTSTSLGSCATFGIRMGSMPSITRKISGRPSAALGLWAYRTALARWLFKVCRALPWIMPSL